MNVAHYSIRAAARRTGLSPHVIRIWEKRYGTVVPHRTATNRRLYSELDIERFGLLRHLTQVGHSIGNVARLPVEELRRMAAHDPVPSESHPTGATVSSSAASLIDDAVAAVRGLDARALEGLLGRAATELGGQGMLRHLIAPLAQRIGDLWRDGTITAAHEHFASAVIRIFLGHMAKPFAEADSAPVVVVATPIGQLHELGALLAAATSANLGWRVTYLGASLPAAEIAGAARQNQARAVALSLVYPEDDPRIEGELARLREWLPAETALLAGGRAASAYASALKDVGARQVRDLSHLCAILEELRGAPDATPGRLPTPRKSKGRRSRRSEPAPGLAASASGSDTQLSRGAT